MKRNTKYVLHPVLATGFICRWANGLAIFKLVANVKAMCSADVKTCIKVN